MAQTVNLPGIGAVPRTYAIAGASVAVGVIGWAWLRRSSSGADTAAQDPASTDPGFADTGDVAPVGGSGFVNSGASSDGTSATGDLVGSAGPTTLSQWAQLAVSELSDLGYNAQHVAEVLGAVISGQPIAKTDVAIVLAARAVAGMEPQPFPRGIVTTGTGTTNPAKPKPPGPTTGPVPPKKSPPPLPKGGHTVTVVKWHPRNPPWDSTIGGIARHYHVSSSRVWLAPQNAQLRKLRKVPSRVKPGDRVFVPAK